MLALSDIIQVEHVQCQTIEMLLMGLNEHCALRIPVSNVVAKYALLSREHLRSTLHMLVDRYVAR